MVIKYSVRHSNQRSWAVDCYEWRGKLGWKVWTRYFDTEEEARAFKERKEDE